MLMLARLGPASGEKKSSIVEMEMADERKVAEKEEEEKKEEERLED